MTAHALEEAEEDALTVYDVEHVPLTGEIVTRHIDPETQERKYVIHGTALSRIGVCRGRQVRIWSKHRYDYGIHVMKGDGLMVCDNCGKRGATIRKTDRAYGTGAKLHVIEGVPAVHCPHCGETYFTASTLHELERLKLQAKRWPRNDRLLLHRTNDPTQQ